MKRFALFAVTVPITLGLLAGLASASTPTPTPTPIPTPDPAVTVRVQFLGRASFLIVAPDGIRFVTDPYSSLPYKYPEGIQADVVIMSHNHSDHAAYYLLEGHPEKIRMTHQEPTQFGMTTLSGYPSEHGEFSGQTGQNTIFVFQIGDVKLIHLGDFGQIEDEADYDALMDADVVFVPVGVIGGIPHEAILPLMDRINARTIVPMHWFVPEEVYDGASLEEFLATLPEDMPVTEVEELLVEPRMPRQVVVIKQGPFEE